MEKDRKSLCSKFKNILHKNLHLYHLLFFAIFLLILLLISKSSCGSNFFSYDRTDKDNFSEELISSELYITELKRQIASLEEEIDTLKGDSTSQDALDLFSSTFDTKVTGYFKTIFQPKFSYDDVQSDEVFQAAYFVITDYDDIEFKDAIAKGIAEGNGVNKQENGNYLFRLGCYENNKISGEFVFEDTEYIDEVTLGKILNSKIDNQVTLRLYFIEKAGSGCKCCNLAYKVRVVE